MGNKYSSSPSAKQIMNFSELSEIDQSQYRKKIVNSIRALFSGNCYEHTGISIMYIIQINPFSNNTQIVFSINEMNDMCKEAIYVPFVVIDYTDFKISLVQNYKLGSKHAEI
jgi:hypothetical protein